MTSTSDPRQSRQPDSQPTTGTSTDQDRLILSGLGAMIAALPYLIGYHPSDYHLIVWGVQHKRSQGIAIVDSRVHHPCGLAVLWRDIRARILRPERSKAASADPELDAIRRSSSYGVQLVVISYGAPSADSMARRFLDLAPAELAATARTSNGRWWRLGPTGCLGEGELLNPASPAMAHLVCEGMSPRGSQEELNRVLQPGPGELTQAVADRLPASPQNSAPPVTAWSAGFTALQAAHAARQERTPGSAGQAPPSAFTPEAARAGTPAAIAEAARLLHALEATPVRDECIAWTDEAAGRLWRDLLRYAPQGWRAPAATTLAVHATLTQDHALATAALGHALSERPNYRLALLLNSFHSHGLDSTALGAAFTAARSPSRRHF